MSKVSNEMVKGVILNQAPRVRNKHYVKRGGKSTTQHTDKSGLKSVLPINKRKQKQLERLKKYALQDAKKALMDAGVSKDDADKMVLDK